MTASCCPSIVLAVFVLAFSANAAGQQGPCGSVRAATFEFRGKSIRLDVLSPDLPGKHPLVLMIHGAAGLYSQPPDGAGYVDNFGEHRIVCAGRIAVLVHYMDVSGIQSTRFVAEMTSQATVWVAVLRAALSTALKLRQVDASNVTIFGESLGGYLGLALGLTDNRVKSVVTVSGGCPRDLVRAVTNRPRVYMHHGSLDEVVPLKEAQDTCAWLKRKRVSCTLEVLSGHGHVLPVDVVQKIVDEL